MGSRPFSAPCSPPRARGVRAATGLDALARRLSRLDLMLQPSLPPPGGGETGARADLRGAGLCPQRSKVRRRGRSVLLGIKLNEVGVHRGICVRSS